MENGQNIEIFLRKERVLGSGFYPLETLRCIYIYKLTLLLPLGYPGFDASRDYVKSKLEKFSQTATSWIQDFPALFVEVESITFSIAGLKYSVYGPTYSPSTSAEGITAPLVLGVLGDAGCDAVSKKKHPSGQKRH